jgi:hypothetical protein
MTPHQFLPRSSATREEEEPQQRDAICILLSKKLATGEGISLLSWVEYWCTRSRTGSDSTGPPVPARASWLQHAHTSALAFHLFLHYGLLHRKKKTHKRLTFDRERNGRTRKKGGKLGRLATRKVIKAKGRLVVELARSIARWRKAGEKEKKRPHGREKWGENPGVPLSTTNFLRAGAPGITKAPSLSIGEWYAFYSRPHFLQVISGIPTRTGAINLCREQKKQLECWTTPLQCKCRVELGTFETNELVG